MVPQAKVDFHGLRRAAIAKLCTVERTVKPKGNEQSNEQLNRVFVFPLESVKDMTVAEGQRPENKVFIM